MLPLDVFHSVPYLSAESLVALVAAISILGLFRFFLEYRVALSSINNHPGYRVFFHQLGTAGLITPIRIPGICMGNNFPFIKKYEPFKEIGWDVFSVINFYPRVGIKFMLADAAAIKQVASSHSLWPKPIHPYKALSFFGRNVVISQGEEWKRHRRINALAFSERNNRLLWDETGLIMLDLFDNIWAEKPTISLDNCVDLTSQIALAAISVAGFGRRMQFADDETIPSGHRMTFKESLRIVSLNVFQRLVFPKWAMFFTSKLRNIWIAFDELEQHLIEMIQTGNTLEKTERYDLFSNLLEAHSDEGIEGEMKLSTSELVGNMFIFLLVGRETLTHTLAFTFGLLALYPEEQERAFQEVKSVLSDGRLPAHKDIPLLTYSMAILFETLRLYPIVPVIPKLRSEDTFLTTSNVAGETKTTPMPQGTGVLIDIAALHHNPRYWEDPYSFKPSRFLGDWPRDAFIPFSAGARACLGRKLFETEGLAVLVMLVSRYKIELPHGPEFATGTIEEKREKLLATKFGFTLTPLRVPLVFTRR